MQCYFIHGFFGMLLLADREMRTPSLDAQRAISSMPCVCYGCHCNCLSPSSAIPSKSGFLPNRWSQADIVQWGIVAVSFLFFYYAAFGCTWGMVPWVYQAEVNSLAMRTVGAAAATATNWVCHPFTPSLR